MGPSSFPDSQDLRKLPVEKFVHGLVRILRGEVVAQVEHLTRVVVVVVAAVVAVAVAVAVVPFAAVTVVFLLLLVASLARSILTLGNSNKKFRR